MATTETKTNDNKEEKAARKAAVFSELEKDLYEKGEVIFHRSNLNDFTTYLTRPENMKRLMEQPTEYQKITQTHIRLYLLTDEELRNRKQSLPYKPEPDRADLRGFIFNPDEIVKLAMFSSHLLDEDTFAFGILLPKTESITGRKGEVLGHRQVWRPVVITSKQMGIPYSLLMENTHKIRYLTVPEEMRLRWELPSIEKYLAGEAKKVDGQSLFRAVRDRYAHYCYYRVEEWYDVNALWDIGTYLHQLFVAYPLKEERGMQGTAKTKTMIVSSYMTLNATDIMINPSEATLFRETEACAPTKNIDEAEKLFTPGKGGGMESDNRVELINASYSKNGTVPRQEKIGKVFVTKWYHVYSPTRISSINGLYGATESRSITQVHTHALDKDERGEREPEADAADAVWSNIRNDLYIWTLQNWKAVREVYSNFDIETSLKKRDLQLWKPLMAIAKAIDPAMLPRIIKFAELLSSQRRMDVMPEGSLDYQLLDCLSQLIPADKDRVHIEDIRVKLNEKYPWEKQRTKAFNKVISGHLNKLGFAETKGHDERGAYYGLTLDLYNEIILTINPQFASKSSESSVAEEKKQKDLTQPDGTDGKVKDNDNPVPSASANGQDQACIRKSDENDVNDESDAVSDMTRNAQGPELPGSEERLPPTQGPGSIIEWLKSNGGEATKEAYEAHFGQNSWASEEFLKMENCGDIFRPQSRIVRLVKPEVVD